ncbi:MAG: transporter permease [Herbinix sp.]|nr:transporter permease [Herbinix sp.]
MFHNKRKQNLVMLCFVMPAFLLFAAFKLVPAILGIWYSMTSWNGINPNYRFIGLENFLEIFKEDKNFWNSMIFTLKYVVVVAIVMNLFSLILALLIESLRKMKGTFRTIFYMPNMISMIIGGYMWNFIFTQVLYYIADNSPLKFLGVSWFGDTRYAFIAIIIVAVWGGSGYLMVIYIAGLQGVPTSLVEAAVVDGASVLQRLKYITLPLIKQSFTICLFVTLNSAFQVFDVVYSLTGGGPGRATQVVAINIYEEAFSRSNRFGYATAKSTILFLVILIVTLIQVNVMKRREEEM